MRFFCLNAPTQPDFGDILELSTRFSTTNTALRTVKESEKHDESHVDPTRQRSMSTVATSAVLYLAYLA